jgi:SAM-dependent methyltransferase
MTGAPDVERELCEICNNRLAVRFPEVRDPQTGELFRILQCAGCGLGHTAPQPEDLGRYYGSTYHGGRHGVTDRMCVERRLRFVRSVVQPASVLDFGCGDGGFLVAASAEGWGATGVEMKPEHARFKGLKVVDRIEDTAGPFDLITLWHSLEHVRSPQQVLGTLSARLARRGRMIVAVPNLDSNQARFFGAKWFHLDVPRHLFHFTPRALERLFHIHGLKVVQKWNLETEIDLFGWIQSILNVMMANPNVLFDTLTRRDNPHKTWEIAGSLVLGTLAAVVTAPLVPLSAGASRGAVIIFAAEKRDV